MAVFFLTGCKTTKYVPMEKVVYRESVKRDTVHTSDSVWVHDSVSVDRKGDILKVDRWHREKVLQKVYLSKVDSFIKRDSIPVPYPVEKELSKWEKFQLKWAVWFMGALCMVIVWLLYKLYRRFKNGKLNIGNIKK